MADPVLVGLAFSAGSAAFLNPCGFAMLPGYVGYALGTAPGGPGRPWLRGLAGGGAATAGFILVFVGTGGILSAAGNALIGAFPWAAVAVGILLSFVGAAMALGKHIALPFSLMKSNPARKPGGAFSFFLYGVAYAVASLSCTLPIFLAVVGWAAASGDGLLVFLAYAGGMGAVMVVLTVALSLGREALALGLKRAVPYAQRAAGAVMVAAGGYIVYYQIFIGGYVRF